MDAPVTQLILLRHGATPPNLEQPARLQGRGIDVALAPLGILQAERTRQVLAEQPLHAIYSSPLRRARQTAEIIAAARNLEPLLLEGLQEGDVGRWEGRTWDDIQQNDAAAFAAFMQDPGTFGYPGGESFAEVAQRVQPVFADLLRRHAGQTILAVSHHIVCRVYLAGLLGLSPGQARRVKLANAGLSLIRMEEGKLQLWTLNSTFHLYGCLS
jgi:broad specificity phosphatase PhoE